MKTTTRIKMDHRDIESAEPGTAQLQKMPYQKPALSELGKVSHVTAGPSFGTGESGNPFVYKP